MPFGIRVENVRGQVVGYACPQCFSNGEYSQAWDSYACLNCGVWLDDACLCKDNECPFANRPATPSLFETPFGKGLQ